MKLGQYLKDEGVTLDTFAGIIGVSHAAAVSRYVKHQRVPRPKVMAAIVEATGGRVTPADFYPAAQTT